jgi:hypothetical protein
MRRGSQDYEYFWLLSQRKGGREQADALVNSVINEPLGSSESWGSAGMWKHNSEEWERARIKAGNLIESLSK